MDITHGACFCVEMTKCVRLQFIVYTEYQGTKLTVKPFANTICNKEIHFTFCIDQYKCSFYTFSPNLPCLIGLSVGTTKLSTALIIFRRIVHSFMNIQKNSTTFRMLLVPFANCKYFFFPLQLTVELALMSMLTLVRFFIWFVNNSDFTI